MKAPLSSARPDLAAEWHTTKNGGLTPDDVTANSGRTVWWKCSKGHEWKARISNRNYGGTGCPYCVGKAVCEDNCLQTLNPSLAKEWHPTKNGDFTPKDVTPHSNKKAWWKCKRGHEWQAQINSRSYGKGCPHCRGKLAIKDNKV